MRRDVVATIRRSAVVAACLLATVASPDSGRALALSTTVESGDTDDRPPLPTIPPTGPVVDRHIEELPVDFDPVAWTDLPPRPPLEGVLAVNDLVTTASVVGADELSGAEDVARGLDGHLYTGVEDGGIWRIVVDGADVERIELVATVAGRPLGIDAYSRNIIVVAVAMQGLVAVDTTTGESWVLADRLDGDFIFFADGVAVARDGTIYVTEASTRYYPGFPLDLLDGRPHGRLLRYEPSTGTIDVVADDLYFANGVVVDPDESFALVAESFRFRVTRVWLDDRYGATEQFGPSLVNGPDNLKLDEYGRLWIGGSDLRGDLTDAVLTNVDLRRQLASAAPDEVASAREPYGFAQVLDTSGSPIFSFHDPTGQFAWVSAALLADGWITFATLRDDGVARLPVPVELELPD